MSMDDYEKAKAMIGANRSKASFAGPRTEQLVLKAEDALGLRFPKTYRRFLLEYGAGSFGPVEFYGAVDEDWEDSSVPDAIWYTLSERRHTGLPAGLVVVGDTGAGELYVLDVFDADGPVYAVDPGESTACRERVASDFGEFLLQGIQRVIG